MAEHRLTWRQWQQGAKDFFSSVDEGSDDPLVDVVRRDPSAAARFIRTVMMFSGIGSVVVFAACSIFLMCYWSRCGSCDRPLRWWLLAYAVLQLAQVPVRFVFLAKMNATEAEGRSLEACVSSFTASPAWRMSKNVSLATYAWFVLGIVWIVNAGDCSGCPGIYRMTTSLIIQTILRAVVALVCFRTFFPQNEELAEPKVAGATPEEISAIPVFRFSEELFAEPGAGCAVCLADYGTSDLLRKLPCGHYFHRKCADQWLCRSKRCPLCMQVVDAVPCTDDRAQKAHAD